MAKRGLAGLSRTNWGLVGLSGANQGLAGLVGLTGANQGEARLIRTGALLPTTDNSTTGELTC